MTRESPLRAQPDSRLLDQDESQQGYLFDESDNGFSEGQALADYRQRYGLSEDPFAHDYSFPLFTGAGRRQLLDQLLHLCQFSNSVLTVLGDLGVGKTRIAHAFMDSLSEQDKICFLSLQSGQSLEQILLSITQAFGIVADHVPSIENFLIRLESFIAEEAVSEDDGLAVVVLDNAQLLDDQSISIFTALLNNFPQQNRLHLALFGEPQLMHRLERLSPESLLINDFYLQSFGLLETVDYLNFRMEMADYLGPEIFTEAMVEPWWRQTQGQLNVLHELAQERLLETVTAKHTVSKRPLPVLHIVAIAMLLSAVGVVFLYMGNDEKKPPLATTTPLIKSALPQQASSMAISAETESALSSTETPVQPLLQSLPPPVSGGKVESVEIRESFPREEVVPLAQLPTSQPKRIESASVSAPVVVAQPAAVSQPETVELKPATVAAVTPKVEVKKTVQFNPVRSASGASNSVQESNILAWKASEYTVQLVGVSTQKAALDFIAAQPNKKELLMFRSRRQGKDWFVVITGRFANSTQARQAIALLPSAQRDAGPWPRDIKTIQTEIKSAL
jgi:DamX protein